jgi:hypothetical protein
MLMDEELRVQYSYGTEKKKGVDWEGDTSDFNHHKLAVLKIFGFRPEDKFVMYVVRSNIRAAVNLV